MKKLSLILIGFTLLFFSCKKEKETEAVTADQIEQSDVVVLNEGNFQWGQGTVSIYNSKSHKVINKVFQANNNQRPLGDVAQSMTVKGDTAYIVVNNSGKIEVVNLKDFKSIGRIDGLNSPRNMLVINNHKAYVSDLYEDFIYVVNPLTFKVIDKIPSHGWTEEMQLKNGKVFVCQVDSSAVYVFDSESNQLLRKIPTAKAPQQMTVDKNGNIWVSSSGGINIMGAAIQKINAQTLKIEKTLKATDEKTTFMDLAMNAEADQLCVLSNVGVFQFAIDADSLPDKPIIHANGRNLYTMNVNTGNNEIYLCDAMDYQQKGVGYRYNWKGEEMDHFRLGIIPGAIYFP